MVSESLVEAYAAAEQRLRQLQCSREVFGHPTGTVEWIETHISWLLLAGDFVYKFKKPLKLDFLDFSTPALRRAACEEELRINRRTAPALYLGLVALTGTAHSLQLQPAEAAPADAEPAVRMRRFAQETCSATCWSSSACSPATSTPWRSRWRSSMPGCRGAAEQGWGTAQAVRGAGARLSGGAAAAGGEVGAVMGPALQQLAQWCAAQGTALAPVFLQRLQSGRVRECHGDLHLANLVLIDGQPQLFDAIEFNPALRWIDCVADIAFLAMDLEARGRTDLAWRFLNAWLEHTGDYAGLQVPWRTTACTAPWCAPGWRACAGRRWWRASTRPPAGDRERQRAPAYLELATGAALRMQPRTSSCGWRMGSRVRAKARSRRR